MGQESEQRDLQRTNLCKFPGKKVYQDIKAALVQAAHNWNTNDLEEMHFPVPVPTILEPDTYLDTNDKPQTPLQCRDIFQAVADSWHDINDMDCVDTEPHSVPQMLYEQVPDSPGLPKPELDAPPAHEVPDPISCQRKRGRQNDDACEEPPQKFATFNTFESEEDDRVLLSQAED